jgi:hypothetical protein
MEIPRSCALRRGGQRQPNVTIASPFENGCATRLVFKINSVNNRVVV